MAFFYEGGSLKCGAPGAAADLAEIAKLAGTPVYVYDVDAVLRRFSTLRSSLGDLRASIHYAVKANPCPSVIGALAAAGAGADVVSAGEIEQAMGAGVPADRVIFSGVAKTEKEIAFALKTKVKQLNVESPAELARIARIADAMNATADVAFRMNPDVNPRTHPYITTGFRENKFGMDESFLPELLEILRGSPKALRLRGLTLHIGSQLQELDSLREAIEKTKTIYLRLLGEGFALDRFDVGGGLGVDYSTGDEGGEMARVAEYGRMVQALLAGLGAEILLEPGRILVARAGALVTEVQYVKRAPSRTFAIVDTGMHHLLRPALYQARHRVLPAAFKGANEGAGEREYDVVGPICESSDVIARGVRLPEINSGDLLAIADAGAYGRAMASRYNAHPLPAEVAVVGGRAAVVPSEG